MGLGRIALVSVAGVACACACGCGGSSSAPPPAHRDDAPSAPRDAVPHAEIAARPLGLPDLASFGWRKRGGQVAFRAARKAEMKNDWAAVVTTCKQVLAADPGHLEAAWLLAAGEAELGKLDDILPPLQLAAAGDFGKWGNASLELPAMQAFLATPAGDAWRRRVDADRAAFTAMLARALIVTAGGDLYAVDLESGRWHRLTRTGGAVIGVLAAPVAHQLAYLARIKQKGKAADVGLGIVDLGKGKSSRPVPLGAGATFQLAYSAVAPIGWWVGTGAPRPTVWRQLDADYRFHAVAAKVRPAGAWLAYNGGAVRLHALPPNVTADWDEQGLASAIRIGTSNRIVSVPSPGLIDGDTATWSPDRSHLAFVAQLDDHCAAGSVSTAAFVADASTGSLVELQRAAGGLALQWVAERRLAIAGDKGVAIASLDGGAEPTAIEGATGIAVAKERPRCTPEPAPAEAPEDPDADSEPAAPEAP